MHTTIIIPFHHEGNEHSLNWTLEGYANQQMACGHTMDVRIGIDGALAGAGQKYDAINGLQVTTHRFPPLGAAAVRNALVRATSSNTDLLIFGNADARPEPDMVQCHADAMAKLPPRSLVLGAAPWERLAPTVLDALIDHTPMIFSYCHMKPHVCYDFRCAYTLNLSVRRQEFMEAGGFHDELRPVYYEDLAFACRFLGPQHKGVFHEPAARVLHRHPLTLDQYLDREELLGLMAPVLARVCPDAFARLLANRDVETLTRDFRQKADSGVHKQIYRRLQEQFAMPAGVLGEGENQKREINALYHLHMPLKLLAFRLGFLKGVELASDAHWQSRRPQGLWRRAVASEARTK